MSTRDMQKKFAYFETRLMKLCKFLMSMENPIAGQHLIMTETEIHIKFNYEDQYCYT